MHLALIGGLGALELTVILVIALLLFGRRLPEVARSLGKGIVEFKRGMKGIEDEIESEVDRDPEGARPAALESTPASEIHTAETSTETQEKHPS